MLPAASTVSYGDAGRTEKSLVIFADFVPAFVSSEATNCSVAAPGSGRAFNRNDATPSRSSPILISTRALPTTSTCEDGLIVNTTGASPPNWAPDPATLFDTPTLTSNSSPGVTITGTFGEITRSPRTIVRVCWTPTEPSVEATATAMIRTVPLNDSGTV